MATILRQINPYAPPKVLSEMFKRPLGSFPNVLHVSLDTKYLLQGLLQAHLKQYILLKFHLHAISGPIRDIWGIGVEIALPDSEDPEEQKKIIHNFLDWMHTHNILDWRYYTTDPLSMNSCTIYVIFNAAIFIQSDLKEIHRIYSENKLNNSTYPNGYFIENVFGEKTNG